MSDFLNKIVSIVIVFVMLVLAPLLISYQTDEMIGKRMILNDVTTFIDQVKDTATITEDDLNKLYLDCNSHGIAVDVTVKRLIRVEITKEDIAKTSYFAVDSLEDIASLNSGDLVQVTVNEAATSPTRTLTYSILKVDQGPFEFSLTGAVG